MRAILKLLILLLVKVILKNPKKIKKKRKQYEFVFKMVSSNKLNPVSLLLMLHLTTILITHLQADGFKTRKKLLLMALRINTESS